MEEILKRRSIRQYLPDPVPDHILKDLLRAAMAAPSAGNEQPWQFVILRDRDILDRIPSFHPYSHMVKQAPLAILVCGDMELCAHGEMWVQDCAASTENLLLAVQAKGLGAVWLGVYPRQERIDGFRKLVPMPESVVPFALVPVGYPAETKPPSDRYKESRVHYDRW